MKYLEIRTMPKLPFNVSEALNQLRVNIGFCGTDVKIIMLTSSLPNEGKSFLAMQLWKQMAEVGTPTLLIDCDLRNSEMRAKYGLASDEKMVGSVHYLAGKAELQDVVYQTNIPNGYIIPAAALVANPTILLEGARFSQMIEGCSRKFACILVDTPPIGSVADALNIATHCDGTVLVVRSGETPRKMVENSVQLLRRTETPLLGIVLNRADISKKSSYYYNRYYSYGKDYSEYKGYSTAGYGANQRSSHRSKHSESKKADAGK